MTLTLTRKTLDLDQSWRGFCDNIAWPTLALSLGVVLGEALVWWAVLTARLPLALGSVLSIPIAYYGFTIMHEAAHGNVVRGTRWRWVEELVGWIGAVPLLAPYPEFKRMHLQHHAHTNKPDEDPDYWVAHSRPIVVLLRCLSIVPHYYRFILFDAQKGRSTDPSRLGVLTRVGLLVLLGGSLSAGGLAQEVLALWVIPGLLAASLLAFFFDYLPHVPHTKVGRVVDTRIILGTFLPTIMAGQNYHLVHHLFPRVPFYNYGRCFYKMRQSIEAAGGQVDRFWP